MLLRESLANNGTTVMIACVSPSSEYLAETTNTLTFATKAANITRQVVDRRPEGEGGPESGRDPVQEAMRCARGGKCATEAAADGGGGEVLKRVWVSM